MVPRSDVAVAADDRRIVSRPLAGGQERETDMVRRRFFAASVFPWALVRRLAVPVAAATAVGVLSLPAGGAGSHRNPPRPGGGGGEAAAPARAAGTSPPAVTAAPIPMRSTD